MAIDDPLTECNAFILSHVKNGDILEVGNSAVLYSFFIEHDAPQRLIDMIPAFIQAIQQQVPDIVINDGEVQRIH